MRRWRSGHYPSPAGADKIAINIEGVAEAAQNNAQATNDTQATADSLNQLADELQAAIHSSTQMSEK